jgi:hypothetical protein
MLGKRNVLKTLLAVLPAALVLLIAAGQAVASSAQVISDCNSNGHLTGHYSRKDLQGALNGMGADVKEYTNCYDVIRRALAATAASGAGHGGGGGGGSAAGGGGSGARAKSGSGIAGVSTRGVYSQPGNAVAAGPGSQKALRLNGADVAPGSSSGVGSGGGGSLPTMLIVVLILIGLAALSGGGVAVRRRVIARGGG